MSGHTLGPWRITGKGTIRAGAGWIARVYWGNQEANARLIAAAPEMLAALKEIEEWWLTEEMARHTGAPHAIFATRAAIAKVEGRS